MEKGTLKDWHQADIIAGLRKKRTTLAEVSRRAGLGSSTLANALARPWPKGEMLIARALGVHPWVIWPSRYFDEECRLIRRNIIAPRKKAAVKTE
ncbi:MULTISPECIES: helix-turn-helix domain-containing protein [Rahnella]|jgi:Ner family transcriptional regulator|uniref:Helix-turn-helix domain-containing protein n=1 Tax=Rahnella victoriana TaxID=1510570 RepID=A0ABS0DM06_9GAMM|nr:MULTISPECIES: helix-turn-helix transcriptional regulator [Rahnella]PKB89925.1 transcriptional regulator [Ewingella americana]VTQ54114.1 DNA-binding transcriptional regulator Nlp [Campylobacter jejuni]MBF7954929.1 helix-turn-helix domain-containing protein [Rahnella victoriana]PBI78304.1 transcriptional regulator [Rahnella victoriana]TBX37341.1 transcriptional regulator [Rahnella victoriana]